MRAWYTCGLWVLDVALKGARATQLAVCALLAFHTGVPLGERAVWEWECRKKDVWGCNGKDVWGCGSWVQHLIVGWIATVAVE
jgi:hypothetical protein